MKRLWILGFVLILLAGSVSANWFTDLFDRDAKLDEVLIEKGISGITISEINVKGIGNDLILDDVKESNSNIAVRTEFREIPRTSKYTIMKTNPIAQDIFIENKLSVAKEVNVSIINIIESDKIYWGGNWYKLTETKLKLKTIIIEGKTYTPPIFFGEEYKQIIYDDITDQGGHALAYRLNGENIIELVIPSYTIKAFEEKKIDPTYINGTTGVPAGSDATTPRGGCWDASDNSFWIIDQDNPESMWNYDNTGTLVGGEVVYGVGAETYAFTCSYDFKGDSIWIVDSGITDQILNITTGGVTSSKNGTAGTEFYGIGHYYQDGNPFVKVVKDTNLMVYNIDGQKLDTKIIDVNENEDVRDICHDNQTNYTHLLDTTHKTMYVLNETYSNISSDGLYFPSIGISATCYGLSYNQSGGWWLYCYGAQFMYHIVDTDWTAGFSHSIAASNLKVNSTHVELNETNHNILGTFTCTSTNSTQPFFNYTWYNATLAQTMADSGTSYYGRVWNTTNATIHTMTLSSGNTSEFDRWKFRVQCCDYQGCSEWAESSEIYVVPKALTYNITTPQPKDNLTEGDLFNTNITIWTNNKKVMDIYANISYGGINYTGTRTLLYNDTYRGGWLFYKTLSAGPVTTSGNVTGIWNFTVSNLTGIQYTSNTSINFTHYVENSFLFECTGLGAVNNATQFIVFNYTVWNETSNTRIRDNNVMEANFYLYTDTPTINSSYHVNNASFDEITLCASPISSAFTTIGTIKYSHSGYTERYRYYDDFAVAANTTYNEYLYLLSDDQGTAVTFTVKYSNAQAIKDAIVKIYRYYSEIDTYLLVDTLKTNDDGQDVSYLKINTVIYQFVVEVDGVVKLTTSPSKVLSTEVDLIVPTIDYWDSWDNLGAAQTLITNTSNGCIFTYIASPTNPLTQICFTVNKFSLGDTSMVARKCVSGATSTTYGYNFTDTTHSITYTCLITGKETSDPIFRTLATWAVNYKTTIDTISSKMGKEGVFYAFMLIGSVAFMGIASPVLALVFLIFAVIISYMLGLITFSSPIYVIVCLIAMTWILMWRIGKK